MILVANLLPRPTVKKLVKLANISQSYEVMNEYRVARFFMPHGVS